MTANNADYSGRQRSEATADKLFQGASPVRSAENLAQDSVFDEGELEEFLADLTVMRRADRREHAQSQGFRRLRRIRRAAPRWAMRFRTATGLRVPDLGSSEEGDAH